MKHFHVLLTAALLATSASAQMPQDAKRELSSTLSDIKESSERQKQLEAQKDRIEEELKSIESETVGLARDEGKQEEELSDYEDKSRILEEQKREKSLSLATRRKELAAMISAMIKLRGIPPEAIIAMPGKLDETLATARALRVVTHTIEEESASLKGQIEELDALEVKIDKNRKAIEAHKTMLEKRQAELQGKLKERTELEAELGGKEREEGERIARLTAKSRNLQDLLDSITRSERSVKARREASAGAIRKQEKSLSGKMRSFADAKGEISLPAAGKIVSRYGNTRLGATFSKGIVIGTRAGAPVVAPYDGEVVFAGPFRDYGQMVILRHSGDFHTLLSGMGSIDCAPGQYLMEGEPVGVMGSGGADHLYMELRDEGRPVDPGEWVKR